MKNIIFEYNKQFKSDNKSLREIESVMMHIKKIIHIPNEQHYNLMIAVSEAVNNAIVHGNNNNPQKTFNFHLIVKNNLIEVIVKDQGTGFDPNAVEDPRSPENLLKESGRGVFLIRSMMDSVDYNITKNGTELKMTYHIK